MENQINNNYYLLQGCMNRLCVTNDDVELRDLFIYASDYLLKLYYDNKKRLENRRK